MGARASRGCRRCACFLAWLQVVFLVTAPAIAGPQGERVIRGDVSVQRIQGSRRQRRHSDMRRARTHARARATDRTIVRASDGSQIEWLGGFDIARHESVRFIQPDTQSVVTNFDRTPDGSGIAGHLSGNGTVILISRFGVFIDDTAVINSAHFLAAAGDVTRDEFNGPLRYELHGEVVNRGSIRADSVTLLGRQVSNYGQIVAKAGSVLMAAGDEIWISELGSPVLVQLASAPDASPLPGPAVLNRGEIDAGTHRVALAAGDALGLAIRNSGALRGGHIQIVGGDTGVVQIGGELDAVNRGAEGRGGVIEVTGEKVALQQASLDASGDAGGGTIHVGGERHGEGELRNASQVYVGADSTLRADALAAGDGGEVIVWSDDTTVVEGLLSARGGERAGDGGFVETSSRIRLIATRAPDISASHGEGGEWLIDPVNIQVTDATTCTSNIRDCPAPGEPPFENATFQGVNDDFEPASIVSSQAVVDALELGGTVTITTALFLTEESGLNFGDQVGTIEILDDIIIGDDSDDEPRRSLLRLSAADSILIGTAANPVSIRNDDPETQFAVRMVANETGASAVSPQPEQGSQLPGNPQFQLGDLVLHGEIVTNSSITAGEISGNTVVETANVELQGVQVEITEGSSVVTDGGPVGVFGFNDLYNFTNPPEDGRMRPEVRMNGTIDSQGAGVLLFSQGDVKVTAPAAPRPAVDSAGGLLTIRSDLAHSMVQGQLSSGEGDLFVLGDSVTIDAPLTSNGGAGTGKVELQLGQGDLAINADIRTRGGEFIVLSQELNEPSEDPERIRVSVAESAVIDTRPDGLIGDTEAGGAVSFRIDGSLNLDGAVSTGGGAIETDVGSGSMRTKSTINAVRSAPDSEGNLIAGNVDFAAFDGIRIGGDISGGALLLQAGTDGSGNLEFDTNVTLRAVSTDPDLEVLGILLTAGNDTPGGSSFVDARSQSPSFEGASPSVNPVLFVIDQDASVAPAGLPTLDQFAAGSGVDMDYVIRSQGAVEVAQVNVADSRLAVGGTGFTLADGVDVETLALVVSSESGAFEIDATLAGRISADEIRIASAGELAVGDGATLETGRGVNGGGTIELSSGFGDLRFGDGITLVADNVALRAGDDSTGLSQIILDGGVPDVGLPQFDGNTPTGTERTFSFEQEDDIDDTQLPSSSQFDTGVVGMNYDVRSTNGDITISDSSPVLGTKLSIIAAGNIAFNTDVEIQELEIGGTGNFTFGPELNARIEYSDPAMSRLTLRAGADTRATGTSSTLDFAGPIGGTLTIQADQITLFAGGPGGGESVIDFTDHRPVFVGVDPSVAPDVFVYRQQAPVTDDQLPTVDQFGSGLGLGPATYAIRSDNQGVTLQTLDSVVGSPTSNLILSAPDVAIIGVGDELDFDMRDVVEIRGDTIQLGDETVGQVLASTIDTLRAFTPGFEQVDFDLGDPGEDLPTSFGITQKDTLVGANLPQAAAFGPLGPEGVLYNLISEEGDVDLRLDFDRANGSALRLQANTPGRQPYLGNGHVLQSLTARANGEWTLNPDVDVDAEVSIELEAGCANDDLATTCSGVGNLVLGGDDIVLRSSFIQLLAGRDLLEDEDPDEEPQETSVVVARGSNLRFELVRGENLASSLLIDQTGPLSSSELPIAAAFQPGLDDVDLIFLLSSTGDSVISEMENVRARFLSIESPTLRLEDPNFDYSGTNDKQSLLSGTLIASDFVTVEATAGDVPGLDPSFALADFQALGSPIRFELIQTESVVTDNLPGVTQFAGGIGPEDGSAMQYAIVSKKEGGDILVENGFSASVLGSQLELQAGKDGAVRITEPLLVDSFEGNRFEDVNDPDFDFSGTTIVLDVASADPDALTQTISSASDQLFGSPVLLRSDTLLNASGGILMEDVVDTDSGVSAKSLTAISPAEIRFERDVGVGSKLNDLELIGRDDGAIFTFGEIPAFDADGVLETPASNDPIHVSTMGDIRIFVDDTSTPGEGRSVAPVIATISKYAGERDPFGNGDYDNPDLFFEAGGSFTMGQNEKLGLPGGVKIRAGTTATLGDVSALVVRVEAPAIELRRRAPGLVLHQDRTIHEDGGVDYVANEFSFVDSAGPGSSPVVPSVTGGFGNTPLFGLPNPVELPEFFGGQQIFPTAQAHANGSDVKAADFPFTLSPGLVFILDTQPEGATPADLSQAFWDPTPEPSAYLPVIDVVADPAPLLEVGIAAVLPTAADYELRVRGGAIFDDVERSTGAGPGRARVSEIRLIAADADASLAIFRDTLGRDLEHAERIRAIFQQALDDYRALTGARRVVGFEFRRYLRNRPNSQFEAYQTLDQLDALFRHHRRSGLVTSEFTRIQHEWLVAIQPEGISLDELSQTIFPSRYVRGSDILDVFGE